jgi:aryl-alcohol dehydrogenase-like predicted oxidoreductase
MSSSYPGFATAEGTARFAARFPSLESKSFYRKAQGLTVSSLGLGSYLGNIDDATDAGYKASVTLALRNGINFLDTSLNYRHQSSERNIGEALSALMDAGELRRDEFTVCTKAGYLVPGAVPDGILRPSDVVGNMHSMARAFLMDQLERSLANLRLATIDVFYLHNPETQLQYVSPVEFYSEVRGAFETLESEVAAGRIRYYGAATWNGFRTQQEREGLSLARLAEIAADVAGPDHHFRFIQLPFNLSMTEGLTLERESLSGQPASTLAVAESLGISAVASASLLQARLSRGLPDQVAQNLPGLSTDAQRAIQFARSAPGIVSALTGMSNPAHVNENLGVAAVAPADLSAWFSKRR